MKKKPLIILWAVVAVVVIGICVVIVNMRYADSSIPYKAIMIALLVAFFAIYESIRRLYAKAMAELLVQFDDENTNKIGLRRIVLYDAVLVVVAVILFISKCIENYLGNIGSMAERYFLSINTFAILAYIIVTVTAVAYTIFAFKNAKTPKYEYKKENWVLNINGKEEFVSADVFTKTSKKGEFLGIEVVADINGERVSVKGMDIAQAKMKLADMFRGL